jgi:HK97 family phage major capsid protein
MTPTPFIAPRRADPVNPVLLRLRAERTDQLRFIDELLNRVEADGGRDLVAAEQANLTAARDRIRELDAQIGPLDEFETLRAAHADGQAAIIPTRRGDEAPARLGAGGRPDIAYSSPGAFVVDHLWATGMPDGRGSRSAPDPAAAARIAAASQNQTTADTPGLLPEPIVGTVISLIDATRPLITSIGGGQAMGGIPGTQFSRPKITQHVQVGPQVGEKTQLPSRKMVIGQIPFTKATYGGSVNISRQDIDWTSPAAWDILIRDLADVYAKETEAATAADFAAKAALVNAPIPVGAPADLKAWAQALYEGAAKVYASSEALPDRIWCSVDVWAQLGPIVDVARLVFPSSSGNGGAGESNLDSFAGNMFQVPRIVVPKFPPGTLIIGKAAAYEVYEEVIGLLSAIEPGILGVEVAYGGYVAFNAIAPEALCPITPPVVAPGARRSSTPTPPPADSPYGSLTVAQLQEAATARGLAASGTKAEIVDRLETADREA